MDKLGLQNITFICQDWGVPRIAFGCHPKILCGWWLLILRFQWTVRNAVVLEWRELPNVGEV
jgi:hypothetical protein